MIRRRRNKIDGLYDEDGSWSEEPGDLKNISMKLIFFFFFQKLFAYEEEPDLRFHIPCLYPSINHEDLLDVGKACESFRDH